MALRDWLPRVSDAAQDTAGRVTGLASNARRRTRNRLERFGNNGLAFRAGWKGRRRRSADSSVSENVVLPESEPVPELPSVVPDSVPDEGAGYRAGLIPRRMRDPEYRRTQHAHIYDRHIEPINRLVDELREESGSWMPYVAPVYGGTAARVLAIFRDPGPKTQHDKGSGMLSLENDDPSAERHLEVVEGSGLAATDLISWNAYPWYINRKPTSAEIEQGLDSLQRLIALLPDLVVVIAHGRDAQRAWRRFVRSGRSAGRPLEVVETYHTSRQAFWTPDPDERARREKKLIDDYARVAALLEESS